MPSVGRGYEQGETTESETSHRKVGRDGILTRQRRPLMSI